MEWVGPWPFISFTRKNRVLTGYILTSQKLGKLNKCDRRHSLVRPSVDRKWAKYHICERSLVIFRLWWIFFASGAGQLDVVKEVRQWFHHVPECHVMSDERLRQRFYLFKCNIISMIPQQWKIYLYIRKRWLKKVPLEPTEELQLVGHSCAGQGRPRKHGSAWIRRASSSCLCFQSSWNHHCIWLEVTNTWIESGLDVASPSSLSSPSGHP